VPPDHHPYRNIAERLDGEATEAALGLDEDVVVGALLLVIGSIGLALGVVERNPLEWAIALLLVLGALWSARDRYGNRDRRRP
jgi:hypothetical protein